MSTQIAENGILKMERQENSMNNLYKEKGAKNEEDCLAYDGCGIDIYCRRMRWH